MAAQFFNRIGQLGLGVAVLGGVVNSALYNVDGGHRAVIFDRFTGVQQEVVGEEVSQRVSEELTERAKQFGFILDDISLTHLTFGREFTQAVEMKQVAQQEAEKARFVVEKAEQQKLASIISAEGDASAAGLLAKAFGEAGDGLVELRRIEAAEDIAYQLSRSRGVAYLPGGQNTLLNLPGLWRSKRHLKTY
ncbi:unnamed protein product [Ceratitis capitata]|uniref:Prohibitin n=1 Tax=Ceratitis capitata TaxID=7213 RepID=A0A811UD69_CERCA|nr:unnamed protein product [Ceratitis capitata]